MKNNKLMSSILCVSMLFGNVLPTFATQELTNDTLDTKEETEVLYNKAATYFVSIPKTIVLGTDKTSNYSIKVSGDIASDQKVTVSPIDEISQTIGYNFYMKDQSLVNPKTDVEATATQLKEEWNFQDVMNSVETTDNTISAQDLTSGEWKGTFNFAINLKKVGISVSATDSNNNDLNANATNIEGETKEQLLSSLVDTGYINSVDEVDGLVNVESDNFDNIAHTTFDVSNLYEDGDTVAILHFDEEKQEWEYICTDTVTDGQVSGDFTSYSPVAFVKVNENGSFEQIGFTPGLYDSNGVMLCTWEESGINLDKDFTANNYQLTGTPYDILTNNYPTTTKLVISNSVTHIAAYAFKDCINLEDVIISPSVTTIGTRAFYDCINLKEVRIEGDISSMNAYIFENCPGKIIINGDIPSSSHDYLGAFYNSKFTSAIINGNLGNNAFFNCDDLAEVVFGENVKTIGTRSFQSCGGITSIILPNSIETINSYAFANCFNLTTINYKGTQEQWNIISKKSDWNNNCPATIIYNYMN